MLSYALCSNFDIRLGKERGQNSTDNLKMNNDPSSKINQYNRDHDIWHLK